MFNAEDFFDLKESVHKDLFPKEDPVWRALDRLTEYLLAFFKDEKTPQLGPGVKIHPGAYLEGNQILIGAGIVVEPGVFIGGPTVIGKNTEVCQGAYI